MIKSAEKIKNILTNTGKDTINTNEAALAVFQSLLDAIEPDETESLFKVKHIQSEHDRRLDKVLKEKQEVFNSEKMSLMGQLEAIKNQLPRESDPEKIKNQLDAATDPQEKRLLQLEYSNALAEQKLATIQAEKERLEKEGNANSLKTKLAELAKNENLPIHDPSMFHVFGENAEQKMKEWAEKNKALIDEQITNQAKEKFGGSGQTEGESNKPKMTLDEIEALPTREAVASAMVENGYLE